MPEYTIDINAKHVSEQRRIWRMFPGDGYRYLDSFIKNHLVFLEMPGLVLPVGKVTEESPEIKERLHLSRRTEQWILDYRKYAKSSAPGEPPERPNTDLSSYSLTALRRDQFNDLGAVRSLFGAAEKGDLVVVPGKLDTRQIFIGEFLDGPEDRIVHLDPELFIDQTTPARRVRWFPAVDELRVPRAFSGTLRIPPAISLVARSYESVILENSYGTFYRSNEFFARLRIDSLDFNTQNAFDLGSIAKLSSVICSLISDDAEFRAAIQNYADRLVNSEFQPTVTLNINSPGIGGLRAATFVPMFFAAFFGLLATANAGELPKPSDIKVVNSAGDEEDVCSAQVSEKVRDTLKIMGYDQWKAQCERAKRLRDDAKLRVDGQVRESK